MGVVIALWSPGASPGLVGFITPVGGRHWLGACVRIDHVVLCECMCVFVGSLQYVFYCSLQRWLRCVDEWEVLRGLKGVTVCGVGGYTCSLLQVRSVS